MSAVINSTRVFTPLASPGVQDPYMRLAAGMLLTAAKDAQEGDLDACEFLLSDIAQLICQALDFDAREIRRRALDWMKSNRGKIIIHVYVDQEADRYAYANIS